MNVNEKRQELDAAKLTAARNRKGYNLKELADLVGVSEGAICLYEQGRRTPRLSTMRRLETALKLRRGALLL